MSLSVRNITVYYIPKIELHRRVWAKILHDASVRYTLAIVVLQSTEVMQGMQGFLYWFQHPCHCPSSFPFDSPSLGSAGDYYPETLSPKPDP